MSFFTELMKAAYPHLSEGQNTAPYMRDMIGRLCAVPEEQWYTRRDKTPDADYKDETLRKYCNRGVSKKLARLMLANPTRQTFIDSLNYVNDARSEAADEIKVALAEAIAPFTDAKVDAFNVGEVFFDLIQESLEYLVNPELEAERKLERAEQASSAAKRKYGSRLIEECKFMCSQPGCSKALQIPNPSGQAQPLYEIVRIKADSAAYENLLALCPDSFHQYVMGHKKKDATELEKVKQSQLRSADARHLLTTVDIEQGIIKVIENLSRAKCTDVELLNYEPVEVKQKIDQTAEFFLYDEVFHQVTRYFRLVEQQLREQARLKVIDDDLLRAQIKSSYKKLADKQLTKATIHDQLTKRLSDITKQDQRYCAYVVSYFVQSCEVFDASA